MFYIMYSIVFCFLHYIFDSNEERECERKMDILLLYKYAMRMVYDLAHLEAIIKCFSRMCFYY